MFDLLPYADFVAGILVGQGALSGVAVVYVNRGRIASLFKRAEATVTAGVTQEIAAIRQGLVNLENKASEAYAAAGSAISNVHGAAQADVKAAHAKIDAAVAAFNTATGEFGGRLGKLESAVFGTDTVQAPTDPAPANPAPATQAGIGIAPAQ